MRLLKTTALIAMLLFSSAVWAQQTAHASASPNVANSPTSETTSQPSPIASNKDKCDLYLGMLKSYYDAIESRTEKSVALLLVVVGWLITSETARKSLKHEAPLFWATIIILSLLIVFLGFNLGHFLSQFRKIEIDLNKLEFVEVGAYRRYHMTGGILFVYLLPVIMLYALILILLFQVRYGFLLRESKKNES